MNRTVPAAKDMEWTAIIERAQRLDPAAFDVIVDSYAGRLFGFFRRLLGRCVDAEDLVQEVFVRVVRMIPRYKDDGRFEAWLFRIATNLARDRVRERDRRPRVIRLDEASQDGADDFPSDSRKGAEGQDPAAECSLASDTVHRLEQGMSRLPDAEREVILLRHYGHLTFEEIAEAMGTPLGTALARAHRGLAKLREWVEAEP